MRTAHEKQENGPSVGEREMRREEITEESTVKITHNDGREENENKLRDSRGEKERGKGGKRRSGRQKPRLTES